MKVSNQKLTELSPNYTSRVVGDFHPEEAIKECIANPLYQPLVATSPVTITNNGTTVTPDDIVALLFACSGEQIDLTAENTAKELFSKTLTDFDAKTPLRIQDLFAVQSAVKARLPYPTSTCIYTPSADIIPVCRDFISGNTDYDKLFASFAFYTRLETLGVYFINETEFDNFKAFLSTNIASMAALLPADTQMMLADFQKLTLSELTESLLLRNDVNDNNQEYSFARILVSQFMAYGKQTSNALNGIFPFNLSELFIPKSILFINIDNHARASAKQIKDEYEIIQKSLTTMRPQVISNNKLQKLTTTARNITRTQAVAAASGILSNAVTRSAAIKFSKRVPTTVDITKAVTRTIKHIGSVNRSDNIYKVSKKTYAKPNRREPDNPDRMGISVTTKYYPDIHVYLDTSGSISEDNYQARIKSLIAIAKKLNVNLYFNSFSHVLSQCTKLHTKGKSIKQIYATFQKVPKVDGGTDYEQVWHYINASPKRRREFSLLITDFVYYAPNHFVPHPQRLYYAPCANMNWQDITHSAEYFCKSMMGNDPNIRAHLLF